MNKAELEVMLENLYPVLDEARKAYHKTNHEYAIACEIYFGLRDKQAEIMDKLTNISRREND